MSRIAGAELIAIILLAGCAGVKQVASPPMTVPQLRINALCDSLQTHYPSFYAIKAKGNITLSLSGKSEHFGAKFRYNRADNRFKITITGLFGTEAATLVFCSDTLILWVPSERRLYLSPAKGRETPNTTLGLYFHFPDLVAALFGLYPLPVGKIDMEKDQNGYSLIYRWEHQRVSSLIAYPLFVPLNYQIFYSEKGGVLDVQYDDYNAGFPHRVVIINPMRDERLAVTFDYIKPVKPFSNNALAIKLPDSRIDTVFIIED